jgi:chaperonin cofactor prefoldin
MELLILFGFLMGWVVAKVQEKVLRQRLEFRLQQLESQSQQLEFQIQQLQTHLELAKAKARQMHLALGWDLQ